MSESIGSEVERLTAQINKLIRVAEAARALSRTASSAGIPLYPQHISALVAERELTALESALEAAGYGMTEEEVAEAERSMEAPDAPA